MKREWCRPRGKIAAALLFCGGLLLLLYSLHRAYRADAVQVSLWKPMSPDVVGAEPAGDKWDQGSPERLTGPGARILFDAQRSQGIRILAGAGAGSGDDYFLKILERSDGQWIERQSHRLGFPTELFAAADDMAYYATRHARIGAVEVARGSIWEVVNRQTPTSLVAWRDGILVGDRAGFVSRYGRDGVKGWATGTRGRPILGLVADVASNRFLAWNGQRRGYGGELVAGRIMEEEVLPVLPTEAGWAGDRLWIRNAEGQVWQREQTPVLGYDPTALGLIGAGAGIALMLGAILGRWRGWRSWLRRCWEARIAYLFLLPVFALLLLFEYWPAGTAAVYSFYAFSLSGEPEFIGWANYRMLAGDPYFWTGFRNMAIVTVALIGKTLVFPLLVAELVFWLKSERWRQVYRWCFLLPAVVPGLVTVLLWKMIYDPQVGFLNQLFRLIGWDELARPWLGDAHTALAAVIFTGFPWISIVSFLVLLGGLMNIEQSLFEAAEIDGADRATRFWRVDVPLLLPQIRLLTILAVIQGIQEFASILVMTRGGPGLATYVPALHMFLETSEGANLGYASAIGVTLFVVVVAATGGLNFLFRKVSST